MSSYVLFSESKIGFHSVVNIDCTIIPLAFVPNIKTNKGNFYPYINLDKNLQIKKILTIQDMIFLIGFDLDENGEFMSHALKNYLLEKGINEKNIIRTPLTEEGYIGFNSFLDIEKYVIYRSLQKEFSLKLKKENLGSMGLVDFLSLKYLEKKKGKMIETEKLTEKINVEGTSTITFVTNNLLRDR